MADEVKIEISAVDKTAAAVASVKRSLSGIEQSASKIQGAFKGLEAGMANAMRSVGSGMAMGAGMGLFNMLSSLPGAFAAASGAAMQSYAQYERLGMSLNSLAAKEALQTGQANSMAQAMSQTAGKAKELQGWVEKLAIESPFESTDIANTFKLAMGMGFLSQEAQRVTKDLLDYASATGAESDKMVQLVSAMGKVKTTGKITGETLQQLGEAGLNATQILAEAFGKTPKQIADDISKGKVDADAALNAILASVEKFYGGAAKAQANSFSGILSSFEEIKNNTLRDFFAPAFQGAQPYMAKLTGALSSPEFKQLVSLAGTTLTQTIGGGLAIVVKGAQDVSTAIQPLLDAQTPAWMTALTALFSAGGGKKVDIELNPVSGKGFTYDIGSGQFAFDVKGNPIAMDLKGWFGDYTTIHWDPTTGLSVDVMPNFVVAKQQVDTWGTGVKDTVGKADPIAGAFDSWYGTWKSKAQGVADEWSQFFKFSPTWESGATDKLRQDLDNKFKEPVMVLGSWDNSSFTGLWTAVQNFFSAKPIQITAQTDLFEATRQVPGVSQSYLPFNYGYGTNNAGQYTSPTLGTTNRALGGPIRGWAMVGESGPELAFFGNNGGHVVSNPDTRKLFGIPGYADGSFGPGDVEKMFRDAINFGLRLFGAGSKGGPTYGPKTLGETGWVDFTKRGTQAMQQAADSTTKAFEVSAKKVSEVFKNALSGVPGLNGLSQVTDLDMQKAKAGMKVSYADDYIRQLSDEVLNGKEWGANIDIKDAAKRAGLDPNLPNELILELVKQAWADKSFFANPANLQLINQGAVQADMEQQQKEARGSANLLGFFGLDNTNEATQAAALGQAIQGAFGAIPMEIMSSTGQTMMLHLSTGFTDPTTNITAVTNMGGALVTAMGTEAGTAVTNAAGITLADGIYSGYVTRMGQLPPVPPTGTTPPTGTPPGGTTTPPGKAVGAANYYGGWTQVHKDEMIYLPQGAGVLTAAESRQMGGGAQVVQVTVASALDEEAVVNRLLQKIRRRMS